jgi:hypothetical protein
LLDELTFDKRLEQDGLLAGVYASRSSMRVILVLVYYNRYSLRRSGRENTPLARESFLSKSET